MINQQYTTVFVDRDGTIGGNGHFQSLDDFALFPYTLEAIDKLKSNNIKVFGLSNQTHIEDGKMNYYDFFNSLISVGFDDVFICPHSEKTNCDCRKPKKGLIHQAHAKYDFENSQSVIIGDRYSSDIKLALECDMLGIHVATGKQEAKNEIKSDKIINVNTLKDAVDFIIK
ncbi:HAD-IIIA family hydrolase [Leuconostoc pseudomesenteroides]|uniref:HAD-IIIA family hydrolase n=1 Tax=Leuconostoc pseudomesenteroides TaxID=33968 RepID=UPI001665D925|nr:HAD-IIIA family hydrolase [Leuconostoc pseudomesenteroides]